MASYFTSSQYDSYLPDSIASSSDIANLATAAEWAVINHYTRRVPDRRGTIGEWSDVVSGEENLRPDSSNVKVYLLHYETDADDVDASDAGEAAFLEAMRRAIAEQVQREFYLRTQNPTLKAHSRGQRSWSYNDQFGKETLSPRVEAILRPFDIRPVTYAI